MNQLDLLSGTHTDARAARMGSVEARLWGQPADRPWELSAQGWAAPDRNLACLVGVDEAGRGPLAGPVSVAAVVLSPRDIAQAAAGEGFWPGLDDSKKLTERRRQKLYAPVAQVARSWAIVHLHAAHIDQVNILQATFHGMCLAVELALGMDAQSWPGRPQLEVTRLEPGQAPPELWYRDQITAEGIQAGGHAICGGQASARAPRVLVDGNKPYTVSGAQAAALDQEPIVKGDSLSLHIAAASILAKVSRDAAMVHCGDLWPAYGFAGHKGYPTGKHRDAVKAHGPCPIHRVSFKGAR
jgi:ribonuclease HII